MDEASSDPAVSNRYLPALQIVHDDSAICPVTRLDRMKRGSGIKGRDDRSSGIEIRIADALAQINPTDPLILSKQAARRNLNCSDSSGISLARAEASR